MNTIIKLIIKQSSIFLLSLMFFLIFPSFHNQVFADYVPAINVDCFSVENTSYSNCTDSAVASDGANTVDITHSGSSGGGIISFHGWNFDLPATATVSAFNIKVRAQATCNVGFCGGVIRPLFSVDGIFDDIYRNGSQQFITYGGGYQTYEFHVPIPFVNLNSPFNIYNITTSMATNGTIYSEVVFDSQNSTINVDSISVEPEYTTSPTFDIFTDGYSFGNAGFTPNWETFESTYGKAQVDFNSNSATRNPIAEQFYLDHYIPALSGGSCFGISATSLLYYTGNGDQNLLSQHSATTPHGLPDPETYISLNPFFHFLIPFWNSTDVSRYIARYQGWVTSEEFQNDQNQSQTINNLYNTIKENLQSGSNDPLIIGLTDLDTGVGHAVVPYKAEEELDGTRKIYIYDPNDPCKPGTSCEPIESNFPNPYSRYIEINSGTSWEFAYSQTETWQNPRIYTVPLSHVMQDPTLPIRETTGTLLTFTGISDLYITNGQGGAIGYQNGEFVNTFSGANAIFPPLANTARSIPLFKLPTGEYTVHIEGTQTESNNVDVFGQNTLLQIANLPAATGSADTITVDSSQRSMTIITDDSRKTYDANLYASVSATVVKEFNLTGLTVASGEAETIAITSNNNSVEITNDAQTQDINLTIKQTGTNAGTFIYNQPITIEDGDRVVLTPSDWNNLSSSSAVTVQTDEGNTGGSLDTSYLNITAATLSPTASPEGTFSSPVTVTLSANPPSGVTIANKYYKIDEGSQQTYASPFTVSSNGSHTITYWSVDSNGNQEVENTKTFTIAASYQEIKFRSSTSGNNGTGATTLVLNKPAGTVSGDVMVAQVTVNTASTTIATPSGWTEIQNNASTNSIRMATFYKVAGSSEPSSYTWTLSASKAATGGISLFSGVDTTSPIDTSSSKYNDTTSTISFNQVTTTVANTMLLAAVGISDNMSATQPSGFTEIYDVNNTAASGGKTAEIAYALKATAGTTSVGNGSESNGPITNLTHLIALRPVSSEPQIAMRSNVSGNNGAAATTLVLNKPAGTIQGDVMVAQVTVSIASTTIATPSGWTEIQNNASSNSVRMATFYKVAGSSEPSSYTWTLSASKSATGGISLFSGVDISNPIDASSSKYNDTTSTISFTQVTTTVANAMLLAFAGVSDDDMTVTPPSGFTEIYDVNNTASSNGKTAEVSYALKATAGMTSVGNGSESGGPVTNLTHLIALKPAN